MIRALDAGERLDDELPEVLGNLRGDVVGRPAEGRRPGVTLHVLLAHAEVCNLDVALRVKQHVVQLQISAGGIQREELSLIDFLTHDPHHPPSRSLNL